MRIVRRHPRLVAFMVVLAAYAGVTLAVVHRTPLLALDGWVYGLDLRHSIPEGYKRWISWYVALGQRGPATLIFLPWFLWVARRERSTRPLVLLGVALVVLNLTVGVAKVLFGRLGPLRTGDPHRFFAGADIYPSGHLANVVVLYGLIAWIAVRHRRLMIATTVFLSLTVGLGTIYLNTHWLSDVVSAWAAGGLVLIALPWLTPPVQARVDGWMARRADRRAVRPAAAVTGPDRHRPVLTPVGGTR